MRYRIYLVKSTMGNNIQIGEKFDIPKNNPNLPEARSYHHFRDILKKAETNPLVQTKIDSTTDFFIRPDEKDPENIFSIQILTNNRNEAHLCYVVGKKTIEDYISKYYSEEIYMHQQEVKIQIMQDTEDTEIITGIRQETGELKDKITNVLFDQESVKNFFKDSNDTIKKLDDQYKHRAKEIRNQQKRRLKTSKLEAEMFRLLEFTIDESQANVKRLDKQLHNLQGEYNKWFLNESVRKEKTKQIRTALINHFKNQEAIGKVTNTIVSTSDQVMPDIDIDLPITGSNHAKKAQETYNRMTLERLLVNNHTLEADLRKIQNQHNESLYEHLKTYLDTGTIQEPFAASVQHQEAFNNIKKTYPELGRHIDSITDTTPKRQQRKEKRRNTNEQSSPWQEIYYNPQNIEKQYRQRNAGWWLFDKLTPGFITEYIDSTNNSSEVKWRYKTAAGLVFLVAAWVLAFKTIKSWFKALTGKAEGKDWGRLAGWLAIFGWSWINSGNPLDWNKSLKSLWGTVSDLFSSNPESLASNNPDASIETQTTDGISSMNIIFGGMDVWSISEMLKTENSQTTIDFDKAKAIIQAGDNTTRGRQRLQMLETLEKSNNQNIVPLAIQALGLTPDKLDANPDKKYEDLVEKNLTKFMDLVKYMNDNQYSRRNPDMQNQIYTYMRWERWRTLDKLARAGAFEKDEILEENQELRDHIDTLTTLDEDQKEELYIQSLKVREELMDIEGPQYTWSFEFIEKSGKLYLKTYNRETAIDIEKKQIGNIPLYSTNQLLKAANLTNRLQDIFAGQSDIPDPFNISRVRGNIQFQKNKLTDTEWRENPRQFIKGKLDIKAIKAWRSWTLKQIAPSLEDKKKAYVEYLNDLDIRKKET